MILRRGEGALHQEVCAYCNSVPRKPKKVRKRNALASENEAFFSVNDIISSDITHKEKVRNLFPCGIFLCCKDVSRTISPKLGLRTKTVVWLFSLFEKRIVSVIF